VTLAGFSCPVYTLWIPCSQSLKLFGFQTFLLWVYLMKVFPETRHVHWFGYLRIYLPCLSEVMYQARRMSCHVYVLLVSIFPLFLRFLDWILETCGIVFKVMAYIRLNICIQNIASIYAISFWYNTIQDELAISMEFIFVHFILNFWLSCLRLFSLHFYILPHSVVWPIDKNFFS
jgi:hypothetical protein